MSLRRLSGLDALIAAATGLIAVLTMSAVMACKQRPSLRWRGIDRDAATCDGDGKVFADPRVWCVAHGELYVCILNQREWLYDCAKDSGAARAER